MATDAEPVVLVVVTDRKARAFLAHRITQAGFWAVEAGTVAEASRLVRSHLRPCAVVVDHPVPAQLQADPELAAIPVVACSRTPAAGPGSQAEQLLEHPVDMDALIAALKRVAVEARSGNYDGKS